MSKATNWYPKIDNVLTPFSNFYNTEWRRQGFERKVEKI